MKIEMSPVSTSPNAIEMTHPSLDEESDGFDVVLEELIQTAEQKILLTPSTAQFSPPHPLNPSEIEEKFLFLEQDKISNILLDSSSNADTEIKSLLSKMNVEEPVWGEVVKEETLQKHALFDPKDLKEAVNHPLESKQESAEILLEKDLSIDFKSPPSISEQKNMIAAADSAPVNPIEVSHAKQIIQSLEGRMKPLKAPDSYRITLQPEGHEVNIDMKIAHDGKVQVVIASQDLHSLEFLRRDIDTLAQAFEQQNLSASFHFQERHQQQQRHHPLLFLQEGDITRATNAPTMIVARPKPSSHLDLHV